MAYQSVHSGPAIDAAVTQLADIQIVRDESNANLATVQNLAAQVATDAGTASTAAASATQTLNDATAAIAAADHARQEQIDAEIAIVADQRFAAEQAATEAVAAAESAVVTVTQDMAASVPTPNKMPLADAQGKIASDWLGADIARAADVVRGDALSAADGAGLVGFQQSGAGAVARTLQDKMREVVSVRDFGAVGDGVSDDTAAFTAAIAAARVVLIPAGTYRLTSTITLTRFSSSLVGAGGKNETFLLIDHTDGPGVTIAQGQCALEGLTIAASNARQAYSTGGVYDLAADLFGVKVYNSSGGLTQCRINRVVVQRQPNHGIYMSGGSNGTMLSQCESNYNRGHGYVFDDGTIGGGVSSRCGIVTLESCRAIDNGGNALNLSQVGGSCYRFVVNNLETIWNAWNTSIAGLQNAEIYLGGENHKIQQSAVADVNGDTRTAMDNGDPRLAKTNQLSVGIFIRSWSDNIVLENNRFISTSRGVRTSSDVGFLRIVGAFFSPQQVGGGSSPQYLGFDIGANCTNLHIDVPPSPHVGQLIYTNTANDYPVVINKSLSADHSITATFAFETIGSLSDSVYLPVGKYRFNCCATVQNGSASTAFSLHVALNGTAIPRSTYETLGAAEYRTLQLSYIYEITTAGSYTIALRIRQASGDLGKVLGNNATFGHSSLQVERIR